MRNGIWFLLKHGDSASNIAKKMESLLNGAYTDIVLVSADVIYELLEEASNGTKYST